MKKVAAVAAGALAIVATTAPAFAQGKNFPDVPQDHWAAQAVKLLADRGIVIGYPDGTYGGPRAMTRYEFAMAISRLIPLISQEINDAIARIPQADMSKYVLKTDLPDFSDFVRKEDLPDFSQFVKRDELNNYYTKPEIDQKVTDINNRIGALQAVMDQFRDQLRALGVRVDRLQADLDALRARVNNLEQRVAELEKLKVYGSATVAFKTSANYAGAARGQYSAGVDRDGALLDHGVYPTTPPNGNVGTNLGGGLVPVRQVGVVANPGVFNQVNLNNVGKHGIFENPFATYDTQIGVQYAATPRLRAVAEFIMGNYYGAWNQQHAFDASFNGGPGTSSATNGSRSNRNTGSLDLHTYEAYLAFPLGNPGPNDIGLSGGAVGRIPTKLTPFTWWAPDPDTYINIAREDSGDITLTGGQVSGGIKNIALSVFGGYQPTDGTDPFNVSSRNDPSRFGTVGFGHYTRPGGNYGLNALNYPNNSRTHLDPNFWQIPTLTSVAGARLSLPYVGLNYLVGTGDDWNNPAFQALTTAGTAAPLFNRFGQVWSIDGNTALPLNHVSPSLPRIGLSGELAFSNTNNYRAYGVQRSGGGGVNAVTFTNGQSIPSQQGTALDYKLSFPIGPVALDLQAKSISPGFNAPGYWGQLGSWVNPWNYVTDSPVYISGGRSRNSAGGFQSNRYQYPIIPTALGISVPVINVPNVVDIGLNFNASVGHMMDNIGQPTPVSPTTASFVSNPQYFRITHAAMGLSISPGNNSGYKIGVSAEDVLRDYPAGGGFKRDATFLWDSIKQLVNVRGGSGAHQFRPFTGSAQNIRLGAGEQAVQSDENYYQISVGKKLTPEGNALAKLLFQRIVYNDRLGVNGGSYRGAVGAFQVSYKF